MSSLSRSDKIKAQAVSEVKIKMKKLAERFEQLAQMLAQFFSGLSVIVIALLGLILLVRIGLELKVLVGLSLKLDAANNFYLIMDKIVAFFILFEFFAMIISALKNKGHVSITLLMGLGLTALLRNLLIIHDDYLDIILNVVGILLLVVGMAIYRHYVHQDSDQ